MIELIEQFERRADLLAKGGRSGSIELLLNGLSPEMAHLVRVCAIPHQFDFEIVQALGVGLLGEEAQRRWEELFRLPVITFTQDGMSLHDKTRRYLFEHWIGPPTSTEFQDLSACLVAYFAGRSVNGNGGDVGNFEIQKVFHLIGADQEDGFNEFQELCRERRRDFQLNDCEKLIRLVHEYDPILSPERITLLAYHEGKLASDRGQWIRADDLFSQVLDAQPLDPTLEITATNRLGMICHAKGDFYMAIKYYQKALQLAAVVPDSSRYLHRILADLGAAQRDSGDFNQAATNLKQSIKLASDGRDFSGVALAYNALGTLYQKKQEPFKAIATYKKSLANLEMVQDRFRSAQVFNNLGAVYRELDDWEKAREFLEKSLKISSQIGDTIGQAQTSHNLMVIYRHLQENALVIDAAVRAIKLFDEVHDTDNADLTEGDLIKLYRRMTGNHPAAHALHEAIKSLRKHGETTETSRTLEELGLLRKPSRALLWILVGVAILGGLLLIGWILAKL